MILIAHRGNINGPDKTRENTIEYIDEAINAGYNVEIDVWILDDGIWLGHDGPENKINKEFLFRNINKLWCHAKNLNALAFLTQNNFNAFSHDNDPYVLTSNGYIWAHFKSEFTKDTIAVMPEWSKYTLSQLPVCKGVCSDFVSVIKMTLLYIQE
jgi:hypothetical protein